MPTGNKPAADPKMSYLAGAMFMLAGVLNFVSAYSAHKSNDVLRLAPGVLFLAVGLLWIAIGTKSQRRQREKEQDAKAE